METENIIKINSHSIKSNNSYFFDNNIWMIYERRTHQILGLQCIGKTSDMAEYVNIFSLAIQQELKIEDIEFTDFYFEHGYKDPRGLNRILARLVRENER